MSAADLQLSLTFLAAEVASAEATTAALREALASAEADAPEEPVRGKRTSAAEARLRAEIEELRTQLHAAVQQANTGPATIARLRTDLARTKHDLDSTTQLVSQLHTDLGYARAAFDHAVVERKQANEAAELLVAELQAQAARAVAWCEAAVMDALVSRMTAEMSAVMADGAGAEALRRQVAELTDANERLAREAAELEAERDHAQETISRLENEAHEDEEQHTAELDEKRQHIASLESLVELGDELLLAAARDAERALDLAPVSDPADPAWDRWLEVQDRARPLWPRAETPKATWSDPRTGLAKGSPAPRKTTKRSGRKAGGR